MDQPGAHHAVRWGPGARRPGNRSRRLWPIRTWRSPGVPPACRARCHRVRVLC